MLKYGVVCNVVNMLLMDVVVVKIFVLYFDFGMKLGMFV